MDRTIMWSRADGAGLEHLNIHRDGTRIVAEGAVLILLAGAPLRIGYSLSLTSDWRVRAATVDIPGGAPKVLRLRTDGAGRWETGLNEPLPDLEGCTDIDLAFTPFTHTPPVRRLDLREGAMEEIKVAYVSVPDLHVHADGQRYSCLVETGNRDDFDFRGAVLYEALARNRRMELRVDRDGVVMDDPGHFKRIWPTGDPAP